MLQPNKTQYSGANTLATYSSLLLLTIWIIIRLTLSLSIAVVDMDSTHSGTIKIHWSDQQNSFTEIKSKTSHVQPGHNIFSFLLWSWNDVDKIQINPIDQIADITLNHVVIRTLGYSQVIYNTDKHFREFRDTSGFTQFEAKNDHLFMASSNNSSKFEFNVNYKDLKANELFYFDLLNFLFVAALLIALGRFYRLRLVYGVIIIFSLSIFLNSKLDNPHAVIDIEMESVIDNELKVYWRDKHSLYNEERATHIKTTRGRHSYRLPLDKLQTINFIRIDPLDMPGKVIIHKIEISELGFNPIILNTANHFYGVDLNGFKNIKNDTTNLVFEAYSNDDFFEIVITAEAYKSNIGFWLCGILLLFLIYLNIIYYGIKYFRPVRNFNLAKYNYKIGLIIISIIILHWFYFEYYSVYSEIDHFAISRFIDIAWALLTTLILFLYYKPSYIGYFGLVLLVMGVLYYYMDTKSTQLNIEMQSSKNNQLNVYWLDENEQYQQNHSASLQTTIDKNIYLLKIENLNNIHNIRIEPISIQGNVLIDKIEIIETGYQPILLNAGNNFYAVDLNKKSKTTTKTTSEKLSIQNNQLIFDTQSGDDFFEIIIEPKAFKKAYSLSFYLQFFALLCVIIGVSYYIHRQFNASQNDLLIIMVRSCLVLVLISIIQLAWFSEYDAHPDERAHIESIDYYTQYWDPPKVGDNRALDAYQAPWGISRLDDLGISYLLIGKFKNLLTKVFEDTVFTCRAFNSALFIILICLTRSKKFALFCIPLLCLPQVWYLFSYANRDSFSFFLALLLGWQIANEQSYLYHYLNSKTLLTKFQSLLLPSLLLGALSIEVSNYAIFILFCIAILIWQGIFLAKDRRQFLLKCLIFLVLAGSVFGVRKLIDIDINGFNKLEQRTAFQEAIAGSEFKPSVAGTEAGFFGLRLQQKGVSAFELFSPKWEWQSLMFKSFSGLYGNERSEYSPEWFYAYIAGLYVLIAAIILIAAIRLGNYKIWWFTALTLLFVSGDVLMGFLYSWIYDFQPQGRYIFPLIPMLMMYFYKMLPLWGNKTKIALFSCAVFLFALAIYSFRAIALMYMIS